jgi:hypothetical protein
MCNLYSVTKGQQAIRELAGVMRDRPVAHSLRELWEENLRYMSEWMCA